MLWKHVTQVGVGIDAAAATTLDNSVRMSVEDGAALAGIGIAEKTASSCDYGKLTHNRKNWLHIGIQEAVVAIHKGDLGLMFFSRILGISGHFVLVSICNCSEVMMLLRFFYSLLTRINPRVIPMSMKLGCR